MAAATIPTQEPPVNQVSRGAILCKGICFDPEHQMWLTRCNGTPGNNIGVGWAGTGSLLIDFTTGKPYTNRGTAAAPNWVEASTA